MAKERTDNKKRIFIAVDMPSTTKKDLYEFGTRLLVKNRDARLVREQKP